MPDHFADIKAGVYQHLDQYCRGRARAIKAYVLAQRFDTTIREVNDIIRTLRQEGLLIGSAKEEPYGYYIPATEEEVKNYLRPFSQEMLDMLKTYNRQKRASRFFIEQAKNKDLFLCGYDAHGQMDLLTAAGQPEVSHAST